MITLDSDCGLGSTAWLGQCASTPVNLKYGVKSGPELEMTSTSISFELEDGASEWCTRKSQLVTWSVNVLLQIQATIRIKDGPPNRRGSLESIAVTIQSISRWRPKLLNSPGGKHKQVHKRTKWCPQEARFHSSECSATQKMTKTNHYLCCFLKPRNKHRSAYNTTCIWSGNDDAPAPNYWLEVHNSTTKKGPCR